MYASPLDIHTHRLPARIGSALVNSYPHSFHSSPGHCYSVGIHPWHLSEATDDTWRLLEEAVRHPQVWAVGEAGLDRLAHTPLSCQLAAFKQQALLAETVGKPLIIHLVKATAELLQLRRQLRPAQPWIVHGFRGKPRQAQQLLHHGFYLSFGEHFNAETLRTVPLDRLLLETDESLLPIERLYEQAARIRATSTAELMEGVRSNIQCLFSPSR